MSSPRRRFFSRPTPQDTAGRVEIFSFDRNQRDGGLTLKK